MTEKVAYFSIKYAAKTEPLPADDDGLTNGQLRKTLERMLDDQKEQNKGFKELLSQLHLKEDNCCETLCNVFAEMLSDGVINWGRILTIFCFSGCVAKHLSDRGCAKNMTSRIAETCVRFLSLEVSSWIEEQGGWDKFGDQFGEHKSETMNWTGWQDLFCKGIIAVSSAVSVR